MKYLRPPLFPLLFIVLLLLSLSASVALALAADPWDNPYGSSSGSPSQRFSPYADGSSRPLNPGLNGRNDDEYYSRQPQQQRQPAPYTSPSPQQVTPGATPPPSSPVTKDFNVWKNGKPTLCTAARSGDVYCY